MLLGFFDGACEPTNPGGSIGIGAILFDAPHADPNFSNFTLGSNPKELFRYAACFHKGERNFKQTSNNVAEYCACLMLVDYIKKNNLQGRKTILCGDSKLVVNQMSGMWNMNCGIYIPYAEKVMEALTGLPKVNFMWIPRDRNNIADDLSKSEMINRNVKFRIQPISK